MKNNLELQKRRIAMKVTLDADYNATISDTVIGYQGEIAGRTIRLYGAVEENEGDYTKLRAELSNTNVYEILFHNTDKKIDESGKSYYERVVDASLLAAMGVARCQIITANKSGQYIKKSQIFQIKTMGSLEDGGIPTYEESQSALDDVLKKVDLASEYAEKSEEQANISTEQATIATEKASAAETSAENAAASESNAKVSEDNAKISETNAKTSEENAKASADKAAAISGATAEQVAQNTEDIAKNTEDIATNKANIEQLKETSHTHENKSVLDNLSESDGKLTFNAIEVGDVKIDDDSVDGTKVTWSAKKINEEFNKFTPKGTPVGTVTNITATAGDSKIYIKWTDPDDVEFPDTGTTIKWGGTKLVYKQGSYPTSVADGILILDSKIRNAYQETAFELTGLTNGVTIYIALFPYTEEGIVTADVSQCISKTPQAYELYGFKITNDSDPANKIQYLGDAVGYTGAKMNYTTGKFEFGSWENSWFIKKLKPCMLKYDGTVAYELNKNNYAEKADGTASDISNVDYAGNVMIGIPKVYWKMTANSDGTTTIWVSSVDIQKEDKIIYNDTLLYGLKCWAHYDNNGDEIDYCYSPAYNGYKDSNNRLRSLSGKTPTVNTTADQEITYAQNNNPSGENMWQTEVFIDRQLINILLMLIGKSTDTQTVFGKGRTSASSAIDTGTMDNKGLFWGSDDGTSGVKVFGIENYWGNLYRRIAGLVTNNSYDYKYKLTYSTKDGSTTTGYNTTGSGYLSTPSGFSAN